MIDTTRFQQINWQRNIEWHKGEPWTVLEYAGAMCGEAGEAANIAKKIRRAEQGLLGNEASDHKITEADKLRDKLGSELAGMCIYAMLLATQQGLDLGMEIRAEFNRKSEELGFTQRV